MKTIFLTFLLVLLSACAGQQRETNNLANLLTQQSPQEILTQLQSINPPERDYAQFHLNVGLLQLLSGDFPASIATLTQAKKEMAVLEATSISETMAAGTLNETLRSYSGYPLDRVMVHNILALSYLFNDDISGARVEMLQADVAMQKLASKKSLTGQLATTHLLAGIIYEMLDEQSNALISYKFSENIINERQLSVPKGLQQALLRLSYAVDRNGQYVTYKQRYQGFSSPMGNVNSQVFALYFDGVVSHKRQRTLMVPSGNGEQLIRISMPAYQHKTMRQTRAGLSSANNQVTTQLIENLEVLVREDLSKEYPSILLLTTTRALAKYHLVAEANQQDSLLGALMNLATVLTEVADLRSWSMLPANIQFAYLETTGNSLRINKGQTTQQDISLAKDSKNLLLISSLKTPVFHYQQ
ncbi:MAG: hypothetical protein V5786_07490 [Psychromonas sp.]